MEFNGSTASAADTELGAMGPLYQTVSEAKKSHAQYQTEKVWSASSRAGCFFVFIALTLATVALVMVVVIAFGVYEVPCNCDDECKLLWPFILCLPHPPPLLLTPLVYSSQVKLVL